MEPIVIANARQHGVSDDAMLHAVRNYIDLFALDEGLTMLIGPDFTGQLLEVGVVEGEHEQVIVHAMPVRNKFLR